MDFTTSVKTVLKEKYATFSGRAQRSEYWWFALFSIIASMVLSAVDMALFGSDNFQPLSTIFSLAVLIPSIAVGVRRLHDIDRTGWWLLLWFLPLIGWIIVIYWLASRGTEGDNRFGADPLGGGFAASSVPPVAG